MINDHIWGVITISKSFIETTKNIITETEKDVDNAFDANLIVVDALCLITITELLTAL